jgi:hypothetical protein
MSCSHVLLQCLQILFSRGEHGKEQMVMEGKTANGHGKKLC